MGKFGVLGEELQISASSVGSTLYRGRLDWDPDKSFAHIADILRTPYALMANKNAPYSNLAEFVAAAKRSPGISFGTSGVGSIPHLVMMRFARAAGIELTHVPYRGGALAVTDAIGGTFHILEQSFKIIARPRNAHNANGRALPQRGFIDLSDRNVEARPDFVFQTAYHLPPVLKGLRPFNANLEREMGYGHDSIVVMQNEERDSRRALSRTGRNT